MTCFQRIKDFLHYLRRESDKTVFVLDFKKTKTHESQKVSVIAKSVDMVKRHWFQAGNSQAVALPEGWLKSLNINTRGLKCELLQLENSNEHKILLSGPDGVET